MVFPDTLKSTANLVINKQYLANAFVAHTEQYSHESGDFFAADLEHNRFATIEEIVEMISSDDDLDGALSSGEFLKF